LSYKDGNLSLFKGDCLKVMKREIPDKSIDLILCDPPYGTTNCPWDSIIPLKEMWNQLQRIIKPQGAICLFGCEPFSTKLRASNFDNYKYDWYWHKNKKTHFMHGKNRPLNSVELISVFSTGSMCHVGSPNRMTYNPIGMTLGKIKKVGEVKKSRKHGQGITGPGSSIGKLYRPAENLPDNVLRYPCEPRTVHPTQKPTGLLQFLIKSYSLKGDLVLDFTMGSGSTGIAALNTKRRFIGIEMGDHFYELSKKRLVKFKSRMKKHEDHI